MEIATPACGLVRNDNGGVLWHAKQKFTVGSHEPSTIRMCNDYHRTVHGSDGSAAGGRYSDLSEWPRSIKSRDGVSPKILSGTATDIACGC